MNWLSFQQRGHLAELTRYLGRDDIAWLGLDEEDRPVIDRRDSNGVLRYAIARNGRGVPVTGYVREMTDEDVEHIDVSHLNLLCQYPTRLTEPQGGHDGQHRPHTHR